jgi:hypothetical protein
MFKFFKVEKFFFLMVYPGTGSAWTSAHLQSWIRIRIHLKGWIRIRTSIKSMPIRNIAHYFTLASRIQFNSLHLILQSRFSTGAREILKFRIIKILKKIVIGELL